MWTAGHHWLRCWLSLSVTASLLTIGEGQSSTQYTENNDSHALYHEEQHPVYKTFLTSDDKVFKHPFSTRHNSSKLSSSVSPSVSSDNRQTVDNASSQFHQDFIKASSVKTQKSGGDENDEHNGGETGQQTLESDSSSVSLGKFTLRTLTPDQSSWLRNITKDANIEPREKIPVNQHESVTYHTNPADEKHLVRRRSPKSIQSGALTSGQRHFTNSGNSLRNNKRPVSIHGQVSSFPSTRQDGSQQFLVLVLNNPHLGGPKTLGVIAQGKREVPGGSRTISRTVRPAEEAIVKVKDCSLLEEAASDTTGQTRCLVVQRSIHPFTRKECEGRENMRTADGTCNNLLHPLKGSAFRPFKRYLSPAYFDGVGAPRNQSKQTNGQGQPLALPSPRLVSRTVHLVKDAPSHFSGLLMQFGQFLAHDLTATPTAREDEVLNCCGQARLSSEACFPIDIPVGDTHFTDTSCMSFLRSLPATDHRNVPLSLTFSSFRRRLCKGPREQRNEATSFLDGSVIYGSTDEQTAALREFRQGLLKSSSGDMPILQADGSCMAEDKLCLKSGDVRVNVVPGLSALHVLFQRQHNRLATELVSLLPSVHASSPAAVDECVFQTARRIIAAQMQHITYALWLPLVLGRSTIERHRLDQVPVTYDDNRDPAIANVFATAAFRFGHSLVPDFLKYGDEDVPLHQTFANPKFVRKDLEKVLEGLMATHAQSPDAFFVSSLRNRLFESTPRRGLDLVALNIQRGRDHGLPAYNVWRQFCGLPPLTNFDPAALGEASASLREVYMSVDDIDVFTGGVAEPPLEGALVGPTFACIIGRQFFDLKFGDRFFYHTTGVFTPAPSHVTLSVLEGVKIKDFCACGNLQSVRPPLEKDQLHFLQETTLAAVICANTGIKAVQRNPFLNESDENPRLPCSQLVTSLSLDAWRQDVNRLLQRLTRN